MVSRRGSPSHKSYSFNIVNPALVLFAPDWCVTKVLSFIESLPLFTFANHCIHFREIKQTLSLPDHISTCSQMLPNTRCSYVFFDARCPQMVPYGARSRRCWKMPPAIPICSQLFRIAPRYWIPVDVLRCSQIGADPAACC